MKRFVIFVLPLVALSACANLRAVRTICSGDAAFVPGPCEVPFEQEGHFLIVQVRLNGSDAPHEFILDTGAFTVIDDDLAASLGLTSAASVTGRDTSGSGRSIGLVTLDSVNLGGAVVHDCGTSVFDLDRVDSLSAHKIEGLLGSNFLKFFRVEIDYAKGVVTLSPGGTAAEPVSNAVSIPFRVSPEYAFAPMFECLLNGAYRVSFVVDTGAPNAVTFPKRLFEKLAAQAGGHVVRSTGAVAGGAFGNSSAVTLLRLASFEAGTLVFTNVAAMSVDMNVGLLGKDFLSKFRVVIDYPSKVLTLVPAGDTALPADFFSTGIAAQPDSLGTLAVTGLWVPSAASENGVAVGNRILSVNGTSTTNISLMRFQEIMSDPDVKEYRLEMSGEGGERTITLKKEGLLR